MTDVERTEGLPRRRSPAPSSNGTTPGRVPHYDAAAERSILGAALLNAEALEVLALELDPAAFYVPSNGHVAAALRRCFEEGIPADPVTVADLLSREGLLDQIGGHGTLTAIVAEVPATGNASRYAEIVRQHAAKRRLVAVGYEVVELGYGSVEDASEAVRRAQRLLEPIAAETGRIGIGDLAFADLGAILDGKLEPDVPDLLKRLDGAAMLYAGRMNTLQGDPASGKTWVALLAVLEVLEQGGSVLYLDYEDSPSSIVQRLLALGAPRSAVRDQLHYLRPSEGTPNARLVAAAHVLNIDLLVIDSVAEALNVRGFSEDRSDEVLAWLGELARPATRAGTTVLMLDHVVKSKDDRGRWARGSGAKLGAQDGATLGVHSSGFNQRTEGRITLTVAKDRHGGLDAAQGENVASIRIVPSDHGRTIVATIERPLPELEPASPEQKEAARERLDDERRVELAERIVIVLDQAPNALSRRSLRSALRAGKDRLRFPDSLLDPVLVELEQERRITSRLGRGGHPTYASPPRQQSLDEAPEESP